MIVEESNVNTSGSAGPLSFKRTISFDDRTATSELAFICNQENKYVAVLLIPLEGTVRSPLGKRQQPTDISAHLRRVVALPNRLMGAATVPYPRCRWLPLRQMTRSVLLQAALPRPKLCATGDALTSAHSASRDPRAAPVCFIALIHPASHHRQGRSAKHLAIPASIGIKIVNQMLHGWHDCRPVPARGAQTYRSRERRKQLAGDRLGRYPCVPPIARRDDDHESASQ